LTDILDRPANDPELHEARAAFAYQPLARKLFALQHPEGYWGVDETKPYTLQGAVAALSPLHVLGVTPDEHTAAGCDSFLEFCLHESGGFPMTKKLHSGIFPCPTNALIKRLGKLLGKFYWVKQFGFSGRSTSLGNFFTTDQIRWNLAERAVQEAKEAHEYYSLNKFVNIMLTSSIIPQITDYLFL
jgi:hypothetical protein